MFQAKVFLIFVGIISIGEVKSNTQLTNEIQRQGKFSFLSGTTNMISSLAQDLISRSTSSSQVLSLNITNLVILLVLKAIIFGASSFGYGYDSHGRSADNIISNNLKKEIKSKGFLSEEDLLFILTYLKADSTEKYDCLHRLACEDPSKVKDYILAGKIFLKGTELIVSSADHSKYTRILSGLQDAVSYGLDGQNCSDRFQCRIKNL